MTPHPNRVKKLIFSTKKFISLTLLPSIVFKKSKLDIRSSKPLVIKLIVEVKVVELS